MDNMELNLNNGTAAVKPMGFFQRLAGVVVSPSETMKDLIAKPRILFPLLSMLLGVVCFYLARLDLFKEFTNSIIEISMAQSGQSVAPEQMEAAKKMGWIITLATAPFGTVFWWILQTAVMFGLIKLFKGEGKFKQFMSITGYAYVIMLVYYVLSIAVSFVTGNLMLDSSLANITNLFAPDLKGSYVYGIIRGIDLFSIWYYSVMAIGISIVSGLSKVKVYSVVFGIYTAMMLINAMNLKFM